MKKKIAVAVAAAMVISLGGGGYAYAKTPVAYVSLDINPSVELGVNAFDTVVSAEAYNEDGEKVLEGTNLVNTSIDQAVSTVISNAITDGYIKEDGLSAIEITTSTDKEKVAADLDEALKETADKTLENNNIEAEVETENVALARRDEARKLGITPGKLNLIQKLQELDPSIKVEDYKSVSVKEIKKKTKELRKNNKTTVDENAGTNTTTNTDAATNVNNEVTTEENEQDNLSDASGESKESKEMDKDKNNNGLKDKNNNGNVKKEENSNKNKEEKDTIKADKKEDKTIDSNGNSNSSKSEHSNKENNKGKGKNE